MSHHTPRITVGQFLSLLRGRGWIKSSKIGEIEPRLTPRAIRSLAEQAGGEIISNTAQGYRLTREATAEEVSHALADLHSRARKLLDREVRTRKAWHAALHERETSTHHDQPLLF